MNQLVKTIIKTAKGSVSVQDSDFDSIRKTVYTSSTKLTVEKFIEKAISVHVNKYDYSQVQYMAPREKVCITCKEHGLFWQLPNDHLRGHGCSKCASENISRRRVKQVVCLETGRVYNSIQEASKATGTAASSISCNLSGRQKSAGGYHWKYE